MSPDLDKIPQELKTLPQWVLWKSETRDGKPTKIPYCPQEPKRKAEADNPATWGQFVKAQVISQMNGFAGIGFEFSANDPYTGVDLDNCRNPETGEIESWARAIIDRLASYTEISPSGCGFHILVKGKLPPGGNRKGKVEVYSQARYFTMTGHHLEGTPATIEPRQGELEALHTEIFGKPQAPPKDNGPRPIPDISDFALIDKAQNSTNGAKFSRLWQGDISGYYSPSEATAALCLMLAYWTGKDPGRMDRLFRQSGLMRDKWDRPQSGSTWGALEIQKAIDETTEVYTPPKAQDRPQGKAGAGGQTASPGKGSAAQAPTLKPFTARELGTKEFPAPRWAIPDLIPEGLTILGGRPKIGKSWFALNLAVAGATGGVALGKIQVEKGECLYLALEDTPRRLKERLGKIIPFGDLPETLHFITANDFPLLFKGGLDALSAWLAGHPQARLVVIDTLARIKPPRGKNADSYDHDSQVMAALQGLSALHQLALIVVAHTKKGIEDDFLANILGSSGLTGVADCVAELTRKARGQMDGILKLTGRDIEEQELAMRFDPDLGLWELLGEAREFNKTQERQDILLILKENGPISAAQLANITDKTIASIRKILWRMKEKGEVRLDSKNRYLVS